MSNTRQVQVNTNHVGLNGLLFLLFLGLRLGHVIDWSWWWVTAPLWIPAALALVILVFVALIVGLAKK